MFYYTNIVTWVLLATSAVAQVQNCSRTYKVQPGDFCDGISAAQNVSTFQLAHVNAGIINANCTNLFVQETLCLGVTGQDCNVTTVVQSGDFCAAIANNAGIPTSLLIHNNPNIDSECTNIYPGEVLCTSNQNFIQGPGA